MIKEVLKESKTLIAGKRIKAIAVMALYIILVMSCTSYDAAIATALTLVLVMPMAFGLYLYFINMTKGEEKLEDLIAFYVDFKRGIKLVLALAWYFLIVCVGFALFVIPGIIWSYRYILIFFILIEDKEIGIEDAFKKSAEMMKGYKFKFFCVPVLIMLLPMLVYCAGLGCLAGSVAPMIMEEFASADENTFEERIGIDVDEMEEIEDMSEEEIIEKLGEKAEEKLQKVELSNTTKMLAIIGISLIIVGGIWIVIVAPRTTLAEVIFYNKLKELK